MRRDPLLLFEGWSRNQEVACSLHIEVQLKRALGALAVLTLSKGRVHELA